jgi:TrmH family RNA methyltransferase
MNKKENITNKITSKITSRNNILIKRIRALHDRTERDRTGLYYLEGVRFVARAARHHAHIETLVICTPLLTNTFARNLATTLARAGVPTLEATPEVLYSLALVDDPQGIGAVVRQRWQPLERVKLGGKLCWIAHETVQSPGNLGSIIRTSDAVGGAGIIVLGDTTDPYDPATVRAGMGATFSQRFVRTTPDGLARWKEQHKWLLVGTSPTATTDYREVDYTSAPVILLMGSERKGLTPQLQSICDVMARIPMVGESDSLNISVATGVMLYEVFNQRRVVRSA